MPSGDSSPHRPPVSELDWEHQYRIVSSEFPPINFFETLVEPGLMEELFYLEGLTNDRLRDAVGAIALVDPEDRVSGPGSSPVMAAFTHIGVESRFSDGSFGVYYAAKSLRTAIEETKFHRARFLAYTREDAGEIGAQQATLIHLDLLNSIALFANSLDARVPEIGDTLTLRDALALALLEARGFSAEDFARSHPGGSLGRRLFTRVSDIMRTGDALPVSPATTTLADAIVEMSRKGMGMTAIVDGDGRVEGIFTDGDLRRCLDQVRDVAAVKIAQLMTRNPRMVAPGRLAVDCVEAMETPPKVSQLLVVDGQRRLVGALHLHDLFRARIV